MLSTTKLLAAILAGSLLTAGAACGSSEESTDRWTTTQDTRVNIDWDKVNEAYKLAEGPEDLERRVNEIYEGDDIISIAVEDKDAKSQVVTGFFDKNKSGTVDEDEKVFTITRNITGEGAAEYQTTGHGMYSSYHSPMLSIASGMLLGSMLSNAFSPRYVPMAYTTSPGRIGQINSARSSYRAQNPSRFSRPSSNTGRSYGGSRGRSSGGSRGGTRFGLERAGRRVRPPRLTA